MRAFSLSALILLLAPARATAEDTTRVSTQADIFEWATPGQVRPLLRRRSVTTLDSSASTPLSEDPDRPEKFVFTMRTRLDTESGSSFSSDPAQAAAFVPGFERGPVDVVALTLSARSLFRDHFDASFGRHIVSDATGWASFDGLSARWRPGSHTYVEARLGYETRAGMPLATGTFEADGVLRASREGWARGAAPDVLALSAMPYMGAEVGSDLGFLRGSAAYRQSYDPTTNGVSREELGVTLASSPTQRWSLAAAARYAMHAARMGSLNIDSRHELGRGWSTRAHYTFFQPTFDAASIWNVFFASPTSALGSDLRKHWDGGCDIGFGGTITVLAGSLAAPSSRGSANGYLICPTPHGSVDLRASSNLGAPGLARSLLQLGGTREFGASWTVRARAHVWALAGAERSELNGAGAGGLLGARYAFSKRSAGGLDIERNWGPGGDAGARVIGYLDLGVWP